MTNEEKEVYLLLAGWKLLTHREVSQQIWTHPTLESNQHIGYHKYFTLSGAFKYETTGRVTDGRESV
jgi:hypothetical protein